MGKQWLTAVEDVEAVGEYISLYPHFEQTKDLTQLASQGAEEIRACIRVYIQQNSLAKI